MASITCRPFDICFIQEVSSPGYMIGGLYQRLEDAKCKALLTGTDLELTKTGGVGAVNRSKVATIKLKPSTAKLKQIINAGRVHMIGITLPGNIRIVIFNVYLWTSGHTDARAAQRSNDLLDAVFLSGMPYPQAPRCYVGI